MRDELDYLTEEDYRKALLALNPMASHHERMLGAHYRAPNNTITMTELAEEMGYANYKPANLHYGTLAKLICRELGVKPVLWVKVLVKFPKKGRPDEHWRLVLRPQVVKAIESLRWFKA